MIEVTDSGMTPQVQQLRQALQRIAEEGDALSGPECQEIAAEALGIPVPRPPVLPAWKPPERADLPRIVSVGDPPFSSMHEAMMHDCHSPAPWLSR